MCIRDRKKDEGLDSIEISRDKGVNSVKTIYHYFKQHGYTTQIMGASFRSIEQILALAGCDLLTIAPDLLDQLATMDVKVERQLFPDMKFVDLKKETLDETQFTEQHALDPISQALLSAGIEGFIQAREALEQTLRGLIN